MQKGRDYFQVIKLFVNVIKSNTEEESDMVKGYFMREVNEHVVQTFFFDFVSFFSTIPDNVYLVSRWLEQIQH